MKAMHKQLWGYLLITLSLAGFTPLQAQTDSADEGGYITVSGIVKDKKSKKSLEYVNISIPGSTTGTVTNADGEFSFKVKDSIHAKEVEISHLGYFNSKIELNGKDVEEQTVWLTPYTNMLDEVIIHARDPRYLVEEAIKKIPANYSSKHSLLTGFYRETAQKGRRYINISEAVIDIYKTPYDEGVDRDRVQIFKGRKLLSQKASDTLAVKLLEARTYPFLCGRGGRIRMYCSTWKACLTINSGWKNRQRSTTGHNTLSISSRKPYYRMRFIMENYTSTRNGSLSRGPNSFST